MTVTAVLLIIWMVVRSAKYFIFWQPHCPHGRSGRGCTG
jgi:hypothetical protein